MSEAVSRKACDRCHNQKLSCKKISERECERCFKAQIPCAWSPSLRYRKPHQNQQQEQQHKQKTQDQKRTQQVQPAAPTTTHRQQSDQKSIKQTGHITPMSVGTQRTPDEGCRSPKRRRTGSDPEPVSPESVSIVPQTGSEEQQRQPTAATTTTSTTKTVQPSPGASGLDIREFDFGNLGQLELFEQSTQHQHLPQTEISGGVDHFHHQQQQHPQQHLQQSTPLSFFGQWDQTLQSPHAGYIDLIPAHLQTISPLQHIDPSTYSLAQRSRGPSQTPAPTPTGTSAKRSRSRRARKQIALSAGPRSSNSENPLTSSNSPLHWMARLSEINARLQTLSSLLPQQYDPTGEDFVEHGFPVDEMFQLTRQIADVLDSLSTIAADAGGATRPSSGAKLDGSDPGSSMFVVSIYVMLLDLYHKVFVLVNAEVFHMAANATFAFWKLPDVTIGSFAVDSTPALQMSLTVQLAEEFLVRLRRSTAAMDPTNRQTVVNGAAGSGSMFAGVVDVSLQQVRSSEEGLRQELGALRDRIEAMVAA